MFIPDLTFFHPGSRIRIKEFKYFNPKKWFLCSRKYDPGCSSRILDPDPDFLPIPDPGSMGQKGTGSRIRIRNTAFFLESGEVVRINTGAPIPPGADAVVMVEDTKLLSVNRYGYQ
jgi:hypothetical protein